MALWAGPSQRAVVALVALVLVFGGQSALQDPDFALLLLHEEVNQQDLLLVDLDADVFGDVWNQPVHDVAHQHHHVLQETRPRALAHRQRVNDGIM